MTEEERVILTEFIEGYFYVEPQGYDENGVIKFPVLALSIEMAISRHYFTPKSMAKHLIKYYKLLFAPCRIESIVEYVQKCL